VAVVRWVRKAIMGIQFCVIPPAHRERLQDWILNGRSEDKVAKLLIAIQDRRVLSSMEQPTPLRR
jgi:hypothetical protein